MGYHKSYAKKIPTPVINQPKPRVKNPSEYQTIIFQAVKEAGEKVLENFKTGNKSVIGIHVDALAGCGKTTTTVEKDYYLPASLRNDSISVAFNADISKVLQSRVAEGVEARTIHSLGRAALVKAFPKLNSYQATDKRKYDGYIRAELGSEKETMVARDNLFKMIDRARDCMAWNAKDMEPIFDKYEMESGHLSKENFLSLAEKVLKAGLNDTNRMDFGDMLAMPVYHNLDIRRYSVVSVDEYQDLCPIQHELLDRSVKPGGLMFTVGDSKQAIYLFRSADSESIDKGVSRYNSVRYNLPRTYRCGKAIVVSAQKYVSELECPETAHEGEVISLPIDKVVDEAKPGDAILSRLNAPMLKMCFALVRAGIPANIMGRDVADSLKFMIKRSGAETVENLLLWVEKWRETEIERRTKLNKNPDMVNDQADCLGVLCEGRYAISDVVRAIDEMFIDPKEAPERIVILSTVHRAKGKEWKRVFMLESTFFLKKGNPSEEENLAYVAETRAMNSLIKVIGKA